MPRIHGRRSNITVAELTAELDSILQNRKALRGLDAALRLCKKFGGKTLPALKTFLRDRRDEAVLARWTEGYSGQAIQAKYQISKRQFWRIINEALARKREVARMNELLQERAALHSAKGTDE